MRRQNGSNFQGAALYGASFVYFAFTTLYSLKQNIPDYETLWSELGIIYTLNGAMMIAGGLMFAFPVLKNRSLPRIAVTLFLTGIIINLLLGMIPAPDIFQTIGSTLRNAGLMAAGYFILKG